jgi:hypothetical protein
MDECKVCMTVNHLFPITCPGGHQFCLSCIKGISLSSSPSTRGVILCPICRFQPARNYCNDICNDSAQIHQIKEDELFKNINESDTGRSFVWMYEGRNNGWWYFDYELQDMLEQSYSEMDNEMSVNTEFEWVICGQRIIIDFSTMEQYNTKNSAVRKVKRFPKDNVPDDIVVKGVAGMMAKKDTS